MSFGAKRSVKVLISCAWFAARPLARLLGVGVHRRGSLIVLYYHAVRSQEAPAFARQLDAIGAYADVVGPDYLGAAEGRPKVAVTFDDAFVSVIDNALPLLAARKFPFTVFVPTRCLGARPSWMMEDDAADKEEVVASADRVRALADVGVRLGAHSQTHPRLTTLDPVQAAWEMSDSKADLEALTGKRVDMFAFPYGDFNEAIVESAKSAGYRYVFSTQPRTIDPRDARILRARVSTSPSDSPLEFWLKLRGGYDWVPIASLLKKHLLSKRA
jgi:peptidoglycan/xylan/chitin deacetylase (PgdA/CDA1 family)